MTKTNKIIFTILIILIIILIGLFGIDYIRNKNYQKEYYYFNTSIIVDIKTNYFKKDEIFSHIEKILKEYDQYTSTTQEYNNIINLYKIHHNFIKQDTLILDKNLYDLIEFGINVYEKTDGLIDISKGNIIDLWDSYLTTKIGIPSNDELKLANNQNIDDIVLLDNYKIKNNKVNINLNYIIKGYVSEILKTYLKNININSYSINMGDLILIGSDKDYKIGLTNPDNESSILKVIEDSNKAIAQTTYSDKYYDYNNVRYHNIINSNTLYPANYFKSIWVITEDANEASSLSKILFMMNIEDGKEYVKKQNNIRVIWLTFDDEIITN